MISMLNIKVAKFCKTVELQLLSDNALYLYQNLRKKITKRV